MIEQTISQNGYERHETHDVHNNDTRFHGFCIIECNFVQMSWLEVKNPEWNYGN